MTMDEELDPLALALAADLARKLGLNTGLADIDASWVNDRRHWPVDKVSELVATQDGFAVPVRLYRPTASIDLPALVYIHGGGWFSGTLDDVDDNCRELSSRANCIVVSVDYSLSPQHKFPRALEEVDAVCRWLTKNARKFSVNPQRIAIGGESAGATLAAARCLLARGRPGPDMVLQLLIYPVLDPQLERDEIINSSDPILSSGLIRSMWRHYTDSDTDLENGLVAPLRAGSLAGLPRAMLITAGTDPLRFEGKAFADALSAADVEVYHRHCPGLFHGFFGLAHPRAECVMDEVIGVLLDAFSPAREARASH